MRVRESTSTATPRGVRKAQQRRSIAEANGVAGAAHVHPLPWNGTLWITPTPSTPSTPSCIDCPGSGGGGCIDGRVGGCGWQGGVGGSLGKGSWSSTTTTPTTPTVQGVGVGLSPGKWHIVLVLLRCRVYMCGGGGGGGGKTG